MLNFQEEILLLALDEKTGDFIPMQEQSLELALTGAVMLSLAFQNKIDTDDKDLFIIDKSSTNDEILDLALSILPDKNEKIKTVRALSKLSSLAPKIKKYYLNTLVEKAVLKKSEHRFLWVLTDRKYPLINGSSLEEVRTRLRNIITNENAIPTPEDVVLICLVNACALNFVIFTKDEIEKYTPRINTISKMDFIGQAVSKAVEEIQYAILEAITYTNF